MSRLNRYLTLVICTALAIVCISCDTDKNIESPDKSFFLKMYGEDGDQSGVDMVVLDDGNFLLLGNTRNQNSSRIWLLKVDSEGRIIWERKYGVVGEVTVAKDIEKANGGFAILSTVNTPSRGTDAKLLIVSQEGVLMDSVVYGYDQNDDAVSVTPLLDGGFIITGSTTRDTTKQDPPVFDPEAYSNIFHYRFASNLSLVDDWYELYGALPESDYGTKVIQYTDNSFYAFGYSDLSNNQRRLDLLYYSLSANGISQSGAVSLGGSVNDIRSSFVCQLPPEMQGGILIVSTVIRSATDFTLHLSTLRTPLQFAKDDPSINRDIDIGTVKLQAVSAAPSLHGGYGYLILANEERTFGTNIWLTKIDHLSARVLWSVSLGSERENDRAAAVAELPDGKIVVLGTVGIADNQSKMALFKLNSSGKLHE